MDQGNGTTGSWTRTGEGLELRLGRARYRVEAVAADILRLRASPDGRFRPPRPWSPVTLPEAPTSARIQCAGERASLTTSALGLTVHGDGSFALKRGTTVVTASLGPVLFSETALTATDIGVRPGDDLPPGPARQRAALRLSLHAEERLFGLGLRGGPGNRRHQRLVNWNVDTSAPGVVPGHDNRYGSHPSLIAQRPGLAWGLFLAGGWYSEFDLGVADPASMEIATLGGELELYLFSGPTPGAVCEQLTRLTGRPLLPPLWALGFHQSRWSYADAGAVRAVVQGFRERHLPLDAIHLDIDYMRGYRVFTWDPERFPDPAGLIADNLAEGVRTVAILDPGVKRELGGGYPPAEEGIARGLFLRHPDGREVTGQVWPGEVLLPDFAREEVRRWWGEQQRPLVEAGLAGLWVDMNEPSLVDRPYDRPGCSYAPLPLATRHGEGPDSAPHAELHNQYGALVAQAAHEGLASARPGTRPWVLTRSSFTGSQRHGATWTGDNRARWEDLAESLPQVAGLGLSGMVHAGADIGGFFGNATPELYVRWLELGVFYPFMRAHTARGMGSHEPWCFGPEAERAARAVLELRYRLLPYLYTLAHLAHRTGAPLLRPLAYDYPDRPELFDIDDEALLGPLLLIAPALRAGMRRRLVELPPGRWYDFWSHEAREGAVVAETPWGRPPLFVRAGAVLTLGPVRPSTATPLEELTVRCYPGAPGAWTLIEDDGQSVAGPSTETAFTLEQREGKIAITSERRVDDYRPARRLRFEVVARGVEQIELDGQPVKWRSEGAVLVLEP